MFTRAVNKKRAIPTRDNALSICQNPARLSPLPAKNPQEDDRSDGDEKKC
jgi:hypothetical protein